MIPTPFHYLRPSSLEEALRLLADHPEAKLLAGGHSLVPAMKLRLAQPPVLIDLQRVPGLKEIREDNGWIAIGAMATHHALQTSAFLRGKCPLLVEVAPQIGDVQVRNRGTVGGSLAHADPASDWPAAFLALEAELQVTGLQGQRRVKASEFFVDIMQTALQPGEILTEIRVPPTSGAVAYVKSAQKASGFAIAGVAVVLDRQTRSARLGVTGLGSRPCLAASSVQILQGREWNVGAFADAANRIADGVEPLSDIHASGEYRTHLARVNARRALELAHSRA